jgi:peptide/nickel transport system permease protein
MAKFSTQLYRSSIYRLFRNKLSICVLLVVIVMVTLVLMAPLLTDYDPNLVDLDHPLLSPRPGYILGTDELGRDVFTRLLYGGRLSMLIGLGAALSNAVLGVILGGIGGFIGGMADRVLLRISEFFQIFPQMLIVLILITFMGQGIINLMIIFTFTGWMGYYRLVRARFFSIREENFVAALRAFRIPKISIMFKHMLPNTIGPVIISITGAVGGYVLAESGLSYLGVGIPSTIPTWGNIINAAQRINIIITAWWLWVPPGIAISLYVLGCNFFGDGLRDVLDPKMSKRG